MSEIKLGTLKRVPARKVWKDEAKIVTADEPIRGVYVGQTDVSLNDLWKETKVKTDKRI
jgi:hypothetical protein